MEKVFLYKLYNLYCEKFLCGGDKSNQERDITKAKQILKEVENGN